MGSKKRGVIVKVKFIVGAGVALVILVGALYRYPPNDSGAVAGWVQAFGSLAAIGLAIWLSERQAKRAEQMQAVAHAVRYGELYGPAIAIISEVAPRLQKAFDRALRDRSQGLFGVDASFYDGCKALRQAFDGIPVHQMPTVPSATSVIRVRELFIEADRIMREIGAKFDTMQAVTSADKKTLEDHVNLWEIQLAVLRADLVNATAP